jgi:hypothetical protein
MLNECVVGKKWNSFMVLGEAVDKIVGAAGSNRKTSQFARLDRINDISSRKNIYL